VGNVLLAGGARTGRDGIHGASFASEDLSEKSEARRPQVQVGDPFTEKLLLEATLELIESKLIVAIQDMGAAGLTSSSAEMAARGGVGVEVDTSLVPVREAGMTPYEIMLSESQERMLVVAEPARIPAIQAVCAKWELTATAIGTVTDDGLFRIRHGDLVVAEIPGQPLVDDCPVYYPEAREADAAKARRAAAPTAAPRADLTGALPLLLDTPSIASKRWVFEQYDSTVQAGTLIAPGGDAGVLRVDAAGFGLAVTVDCNSRLLALDPYEGGKATVAEAARNIACTGAMPLGITDCLNFGNPEKPEVFFQFREACRGIGEACRAFDTPVTGGNVSFYNESPTGAIDPTPTVGMVVRDFTGGTPAAVDLEAERGLQRFLVAAARAHLLRSAHDCSAGGLAVTLAEAAMGGPYAGAAFGAKIDLASYGAGTAEDGLLFGEDGARAVVSCAPADVERLKSLAAEHRVPVTAVGEVGEVGGALVIRTPAGTRRWAIEDLRRTYFEAIPRRMSHVDEDRAEGQ
jgi:phosphoribosylformylglycinamidine (FGAM) synthase-like enzyme